MIAAENDSIAAAAAAAEACQRLHSIFDEAALYTETLRNSTASSSPAAVNYSSPLQSSTSTTPVDWLSVVATSFVNPVFCGFGVFGNVLTIVILCVTSLTDRDFVPTPHERGHELPYRARVQGGADLRLNFINFLKVFLTC